MLLTHTRRKYLASFIFLFFYVLSFSQYVVDVRHFSINDGLSHREVLCTFQDSRGFVWVGTKYGLNRFTGHDFQVFTKEKHGLEANEVQQILEDNDGWLWIFKGVSSFSRTQFTHLSFLNIYTLEVLSVEERFLDAFPVPVNQIYTAISNDHHTVFLGTTDGKLLSYSSKSGFQIAQVSQGENLNLDLVNASKRILGTIYQENSEIALEIDSLGKILWSYPNEQGGSKSLASVFHQNLDKSWRYTLVPDENQVTIKNATANNRLTPTSFAITTSSAGHKVFIYHKETDNTFWLISAKDFLVFDPSENSYFDLKEHHPEIFNSQVYRIYFDNRDNVWLATAYGLYCIQLKKSSFKKYLSQPLDNYQINTAFSSRGIAVLGEKMWVNGIETAKTCQVDLVSEEVKELPEEQMTGINEEMNFKAVLAINEEELLQAGIGQSIYNTKTQTHLQLNWDGYDYQIDNKLAKVWSLFKGHKEVYWLGLQDEGLAYWKGDTPNIQFFDQYNQFEALQYSTVYSFLEWDEEHVLIGSTSGIFILNWQNGVIRQLSEEGQKEFFLPQNTVYHLHRDRTNKNIVWVATDGGGLIKLTLSLQMAIEKHKQFTLADGFSSNIIYAVYEDENNNLWMPSNYGLIKMNKTTQAVKAYTEQDGIAHNEFNRISHFQDETGRLYFGGINGLTVFHPEQLLDVAAEFDAPLQITKFQQYDGNSDKIVDLTSEIIQNPKIVLHPNDKFFNLEFALLEYQDVSQVRYSYQISGQDDNWTILSENNLRISGLPYGDFVLRIRGQGVSGQFSTQVLVIPIQVIRPIYQRWWFILSAILLLGLVLFYFYQRRTNELKNRQAKLEKLVQVRTQTIQQQAEELRSLDTLKSRFFANVSHELRTPLTLMIAPIEAALKDSKLSNRTHTHLLLARKNGDRLNRMISEILDLTRLEAGKLELRPEKVVWYNFLRTLVANFESIANGKNIEFQFQYQDSKTLVLSIDKSKMEIILLNLLSNAFKFTPQGGTVTFLAKEGSQFLEIEIRDTGRGIHPEDLPHVFDRFYQAKKHSNTAEGGTGIGLALSKELVVLMKGQITAESEIGEGSTFFVKIPRVEIISQLAFENVETHKEADISFAMPQHEGSKETNSDTTQTQILLVEDNHDLRNFIAQTLSDYYDVLTAENGVEALEKLSNNPTIQLILSDIMMPVMDGYQLLEKVKSTPELRHIPVIMLTARAGLDDKLKALRIGVDDYLNKPFNEEELLVRIENLIQNSKSRVSQVSEDAEIEEEETTLSEKDLIWLKEAEQEVLAGISSFEFSIETLATALTTNRWQLSKRLKNITGLTTNQYIQEIRLNHARNLLETGQAQSIKRLTYDIGMKDSQYFARLFKKRFGRNPSSFL